MPGLPPSFPGPLTLLPPPAAGEAWACLDLPGGSGVRVEGRGPFRSSSRPPDTGVAFYVNDFSLSSPDPWKIPARTGTRSPLPASGPRGACPDVPDAPSAAAREKSGAAEPWWKEGPAFPAAEWEEADRARFEEVFRECMAAVRQRRLLKIVPASPVRGKAAEDPARALYALLDPVRVAGMGHAAAWCGGDSGFAAITPEVLFELSGRRLTTMALAGTADAQHEADLRHGPKLAREHEIVVDELHRRLAGLGKVRLSAREVVPLGNVRHLRTCLTVDLPEQPRGQALNDLLRLLHPTPALGVSPRTDETMRQLMNCREHCGVPPQFGAPLGLVWPGGAVFLVAIRGVFWRGRTLQVPAGGGLVSGSELEHEWAELELKRHWIRQAFHLDAAHV